MERKSENLTTKVGHTVLNSHNCIHHLMDFREILDHARNQCRSMIVEAAAGHRLQGRRVILEPIPRLEDGAVCFAPDGLRLPLRYDLVHLDNMAAWRQQMVDSPTIHFESLTCINWEHRLSITTHRIAWDYVVLRSSLPAVHYEPKLGTVKDLVLEMV
jgi:hypothetical protein